MPPLCLRLFGPGEVMLGGVPQHVHSVKALGLLAYLVLESDRAHARAKLAALLWAELPAASARQCLRQALYSLKSLGSGRLDACLHADHELLRFVPSAALDIDVHRFLAASRSADEPRWREAVALYGAPLLEGRDFAGCADYEAWLAATRERHRALALQTLDRLARQRTACADWDGTRAFAMALRALDPGSEAACRHLLRAWAGQGELQALDNEWARFTDRLARDLGVGPTDESLALYRALGGGRALHAAQPPQDPAAHLPAAAHRPSGAEGIDAIVGAGRAAERVYAFAHAVELYERALRLLHGTAAQLPRRRLDLLLLKQGALERLGNRTQQTAVLDQALQVAAAIGDDAALAATLLRRAGASAYLGRHADAQRDAGRALDLYRRLADTPGEAEALREIGFVCWHAGDHGAALRLARETLDLHRRMGDVTGEATALHNLAEIQRSLGSPQQAADGFERAVQLHWAAGSRSGEILSLFGWAQALQQAGDPAAALPKYQAALQLSEQHGERTMHARALHAMAMHCAAQAQFEPALALLRRAIEVDRAIGYAHALGHDLVDLSDLHLARGEFVQARAALHEATVWFGFTEDESAIAATRLRLRDVDARRDRPPVPEPTRWVKSHLDLGEGKVYCAFESGCRTEVLPGVPVR